MYYLTIALIQRDWSDRMEYNTASPIYLQVINELKKRMVKGELKPGEKMPSNRELAVLFKVNQNTSSQDLPGDGEHGAVLYKAWDRNIRFRGG